MSHHFALSGDLGRSLIALACLLAAGGIVLLVIELWRAHRSRAAAISIGVSGFFALVALLLAVLRPVAIVEKGTMVGPKVVVLADASRSIDLPGFGGTRRQALAQALGELDKRSSEVRLSLLSFGEGPPVPVASTASNDGDAGARPGTAGTTGTSGAFRVRAAPRSDLVAALEALSRAADERPAALVVLSDGRLDRPGETGTAEALLASLGALKIPVHTVSLASDEPRDASIRKVLAAGAAVAHQPFSLRIEIACDGGLSCADVPVVARELREQGEPTVLASGTAHVVGGKATVELSMTIERAGSRILEVAITPPDGDTIPENDRRLLSLDVTRDRVRVLHVAGRPTYDVRALRMWLKSDASVDVVAFFILRTPNDDVQAGQNELALIPFPVDELFSEHLPSFDAVVLQDFDASPYGLTKHLPSLARYVDKGGGLIMVGGPDAFGPGHYGGTKLADVLPVEIEADRRARESDLSSFVPRFTRAGRAAPVLAPLRALLGEDLPEMPGTNIVGDVRKGAVVLLEHPTRTTASGAPMPVLALGEYGSGRTMALTIDGSHRLLFSAFAASAAGRAHGAFWDAMLGWLMRDPRFEPAAIDLVGGCIAGEETTLSLHPLPGPAGEASVKIIHLGSGEVAKDLRAPVDGSGAAITLPAGKLAAGGYTAVVEIAEGADKTPTTRRDFACETGGDEWADPRPDEARLKAIAAATGGRFVRAESAGSLPLPEATQVALQRQVAPILPPWAWTLGAAVLLGAHWIVRRRGGLS
ncbi:MAG: glutamine amidotransferase [Byssovorax sp.]